MLFINFARDIIPHAQNELYFHCLYTLTVPTYIKEQREHEISLGALVLEFDEASRCGGYMAHAYLLIKYPIYLFHKNIQSLLL